MAEANSSTTYNTATGIIIQCSAGSLGVVGNILVIFVFSRASLSNLRCSVYFRVRAVVDTCLILAFALIHLIKFLDKTDKTYNTNGQVSFAKMKHEPVENWIMHSLAMMSAWIIVIISFERLVATSRPATYKSKCTRKTAFLNVTVIVPFFLLANIHIFFCKEGESGDESLIPVPIYFASMYSIIPALIITACNAYLCHAVKKLRDGGEKLAKATTLMLFVSSICHVLLTLPFSIFQITMGTDVLKSLKLSTIFKIYEVCAGLVAINHTMNAVFYGISNTLFRQELMNMLRCSGTTKTEIVENAKMHPMEAL